jgi:hypothetical protein
MNKRISRLLMCPLVARRVNRDAVSTRRQYPARPSTLSLFLGSETDGNGSIVFILPSIVQEVIYPTLTKKLISSRNVQDEECFATRFQVSACLCHVPCAQPCQLTLLSTHCATPSHTLPPVYVNVSLSLRCASFVFRAKRMKTQPYKSSYADLLVMVTMTKDLHISSSHTGGGGEKSSLPIWLVIRTPSEKKMYIASWKQAERSRSSMTVNISGATPVASRMSPR